MQEMYTFDDVLLVPQYSAVRPGAVDVAGRFSRNIPLRLPFVSASMDTVTEHRMAIALALSGGIGVIHKNLTIDEQAREVALVKRFENGFITDPLTVRPDNSIADVYAIRRDKGYKTIPVVDAQGKLLGVVGKLDYFWPHDKHKKVREVMMSVKDMVTAPAGTNLKKANEIIRVKKLSVLCLVEKSGRLAAIVTRKDLEKNELYPSANKADDKTLRVAAAVGVAGDSYERALALADKKVDALVVDTAHGHARGVMDTLKVLKKETALKGIDIVVGNVATAAGVKALVAAGADGVKIGIGPGSICTTRVVAGIGVPQLSAVMAAAKGRGKSDVPLIADGGIKYSGDVVKALAAGADAAMMGSFFAGTDEAPGTVEYYNGRMYKIYRGMGSVGAMQLGSKDRYGQGEVSDNAKLVPEGIEGRILYRGPVETLLFQLAGGVRAGMSYVGAATLPELQRQAEFIKISPAGLKESHPHDVEITKQAPNYS